MRALLSDQSDKALLCRRGDFFHHRSVILGVIYFFETRQNAVTNTGWAQTAGDKNVEAARAKPRLR